MENPLAGRPQTRSLASDPFLELNDATVVLGDTRVLESLRLTVQDGEHTAVLGPNGAGKSTLMKLLALEIYPAARDDGTPVRIFGRDRWDVFELRSQMGIVSADVHDRFVHGNSNGAITGRDAVVSGFFATQGVFGHQAVTDRMRGAAADALDRMSTGEARRVLIARALVHNPKALVLDEPTRGLDVVSRYRFMERVRQVARDGTTLLLVTHYADEIIPEIGRVILLDRGRIAADGAKPAVLTAPLLSRVFGGPLTVSEDGGYYHFLVSRGAPPPRADALAP
ncbi:MAG: ABC transporter ATP-binding protein [Acidobacteria bacterium]|nr:MAG: ABC transporter ATP-binding protein [Acidobacteriota bacterium]